MMKRSIPSIDSEAAWKLVEARDSSARFFYGVTTTGVFCRPSCASRRPLRANVRFFATVDEAKAAGFRPCLRCRPIASSSPLELVRVHIEQNYDRAIPLAELGRIAGLSPFTVQRLFKQTMGASPLEYQRSLRAGKLRASLKRKVSVTDAFYEAGFGSSSRGYEGAALGMSPARFAKGGKGERIAFCSAVSPFGWIVVGSTERGVCWLALGGTKAEAEASLREEFPEAKFERDAGLAKWIEAALASVRAGAAAAPNRLNPGQSLDLRGTVFQLRVWEALRRIPRGETRSYSELAREMGEPNATRAVARACAMNRVSVLVPCHRVVGKDGSLTGYRWGVERKRRLLEAEKPASSF